MPRHLTTLQRSTAETVYETIASMLPEGGMCEQIWLPDLVRGLGMQDDPKPIWQAIKDLLSMELVQLRFVDPAVKLSAEDERLMMRGPAIGLTKNDDSAMMLGYIGLATNDVCGIVGCSRFDYAKQYPPLCCVDKLTEKDVSVIRIGTSKKSSAARREAAQAQAEARRITLSCHIDLREYDLIAVNSSGGKDSQAMLDAVVRKACELGVLDRVHVYHGDLKDIEWSGSRELAELQARYYGVPFTATSNEKYDDLLDHVSDRGEWPAGGAQSRQYCTADMKRQPINKMFTEFATAHWNKVEQEVMVPKLRQMLGPRYSREQKKYKTVRTLFKNVMNDRGKPIDLKDFRPKILNCIGVRAEESKARAKKPPLTLDSGVHGSSGEKKVDTWFPIFTWTRKQVWEVIADSGVPHHWAYDLGMPRLSCVFCVMGNQAAIAIGSEYNPQLFQRYIAMEDELRSRHSLTCSSKKRLKPGCTLTAKAKRDAVKRGEAKPEALDMQANARWITRLARSACPSRPRWRPGSRVGARTSPRSHRRAAGSGDSAWDSAFGRSPRRSSGARRTRAARSARSSREDPNVDSFL